MGPKKTSSKEENSCDLVLAYLRAQNRPYSATDISSNLHNRVTKAKADKILKDMRDKGEISGNSSGKQPVYWCLQDPADAAAPEELGAIDESIASLRERLPTLKAELKTKNAALTTLRSAPTTEALRGSVEDLIQQTGKTEARLQDLRSGHVKPISPGEREKTEAEFRQWLRTREVRRKIFKELEGMVSEGLGMSKEKLWVSRALPAAEAQADGVYEQDELGIDERCMSAIATEGTG